MTIPPVHLVVNAVVHVLGSPVSEAGKSLKTSDSRKKAPSKFGLLIIESWSGSTVIRRDGRHDQYTCALDQADAVPNCSREELSFCTFDQAGSVPNCSWEGLLFRLEPIITSNHCYRSSWHPSIYNDVIQGIQPGSFGSIFCVYRNCVPFIWN